jgi:MFS family permease
MNVRDRLPPLVVLKYYAFMATGFGGFHIPITVLIMQARGMTYTQIGTLMAVSSAVLVTMEIPMGYVGDRIGRRNSVIIGTALVVLGMLGIGSAHTYWGFFGAKATFALGTTFRSGSGSAWIYEILEAHGLEDRYAHVSGRAQTLFLVVLGGGSLLGGYVADVNISYPYFIDAVIVTFSLLVLLTVPKTPQYADSSDEDAASGDGDDADDADLTFRRALVITREKFTSPPLRSFILLVGLFVAIAKATNSLFVQPAALEVGLDVSHVGWMYTGFTATSAGATYFAGTIKERLGIERFFAIAPFLVGASLAAATVVPIGVIPAFFVMRGLRRVSTPFAHQYLNDRLPGLNRATALSVFSMITQVFVFVLTVGGGPVGDAVGPILGVALLGGVLVASAAAIWLVDPPTESDSPASGPDGVDTTAK